MLNKTKAALQSCQCHRAELNHNQDSTLIGLVNPDDVCSCEPQTPETALVSGKGCSDVSNGYSFTSLACLRCRRFISPFTAVTMNCAFVSPYSRLLSKSATTSCGNRAFSCCDLLLVEPVAIPESPHARCDSVYAKKMTIKDLKCDSLVCSFKSTGAIHLVSSKPGSASTLTGPLTTALIGVTKMADTQSTQTHPEYTWRFLCHTSEDPSSPLIVILTVAATEGEARANCSGCNPVFAARLPFHSFEFVEVHHA